MKNFNKTIKKYIYKYNKMTPMNKDMIINVIIHLLFFLIIIFLIIK